MTEDEIKDAVIQAVNSILPERSLIIRTIESTVNKVFSTAELESRRESIEIELSGISTMIENLIKNNASELQDQNAYLLQYGKLSEQFKAKKNDIENIDVAIADRIATKANIRKFVEELRRQPEIIAEFSDELFTTLVERITVKSKSEFTVEFKDGSSRKVSI